jgi:hypothetical protein
VKTIKLDIEPTSRTDLLCARCGGFRTEFIVRGSDHVGVHKRCLREAREAPKARPRPPIYPLSDCVVVTEGAVVKGPMQRPTRVSSREEFERVFGKVEDGVAGYIERTEPPSVGQRVVADGREQFLINGKPIVFPPGTNLSAVTSSQVATAIGGVVSRKPAATTIDLDAVFDLSD